MKVKAIGVTLTALGLAWTGAFPGTPKNKLENWYRAETEKANVRFKEAGFPNDLSVAIASYERGVFSSKVHFALRLPERCGLPKELVLIDALNQGPFPWPQIKQGNLRPALLASHAVVQEDAVTQALVPGCQRSDAPGHHEARYRFPAKYWAKSFLRPY